MRFGVTTSLVPAFALALYIRRINYVWYFNCDFEFFCESYCKLFRGNQWPNQWCRPWLPVRKLWLWNQLKTILIAKSKHLVFRLNYWAGHFLFGIIDIGNPCAILTKPNGGIAQDTNKRNRVCVIFYWRFLTFSWILLRDSRVIWRVPLLISGLVCWKVYSAVLRPQLLANLSTIRYCILQNPTCTAPAVAWLIPLGVYFSLGN